MIFAVHLLLHIFIFSNITSKMLKSVPSNPKYCSHHIIDKDMELLHNCVCCGSPQQRIMIKHTFLIWRLILWILVLQTMRKKSASGIFFISCKIPPTKCKLLFAIYIANPKKFLFPHSRFFLTFSFRKLLHLVRGFQKGMTLGYQGHVCRFGPSFCTFFARNN